MNKREAGPSRGKEHIQIYNFLSGAPLQAVLWIFETQSDLGKGVESPWELSASALWI